MYLLYLHPSTLTPYSITTVPHSPPSRVSQFKASCLTLYLSHRCWSFEESFPPDFMNCSCQYFSDLFMRVRGYLSADTEGAKHRHAQLVYDSFSQLSLLNDVMRIQGIPPPLVGTMSSTLGKVIFASGQGQGVLRYWRGGNLEEAKFGMAKLHNISVRYYTMVF